MDNKLSTIIEKLKKNPLFVMSLGNKELFHSNFWAWIMELEKDSGKYSFISFFFNIPQEQFDSKIIIEREKENRDITVTIGDKSYVIENKIKSIPTEKQLKKYTEKLGKKFASGILTGVKSTLNIEDSELKGKWTFKNYNDIGKFLENYRIELDDKYDNEYINQTIDKYSKLLITTDELFGFVENNFKNKMPNSEQEFYAILEEIKMADICKKFVCSKFEAKLKKSSDLKFENENWELKIESGFSDKNAIIDIFITKKGQSNEKTFIGIQIEGSQYRRVVNISGKKPDEIFNYFTKLNWFDGNYDSKRSKEIKFANTKIATKMQNKFCKYKPSFTYQYYSITDFSFDSLTDTIITDIKVASELLEKI